MTGESLHILGCGILKKEVRFLAAKNGWDLDAHFYESSLHVDFNRLGLTLEGAIAKHGTPRTVVFYGECHPRMEEMLGDAHLSRLVGQNCIDFLLGPERFHDELEAGAFFLLEDWALRFESIAKLSFGTARPEMVQQVYREGGRTRMLALRTPCSSDFAEQANAAAHLSGLPLEWLEVGLEHLEQVLLAAFAMEEA